MVSFSCESCGDVLTKKKLDSHRNQCGHASFTCLDCMVHFQGTSYRAHTSCISEVQKYEGSMHQENKLKKSRNRFKSSKLEDVTTQTVSNISNALTSRSCIEDRQDNHDLAGAISIVDAPPHAPSPPPAISQSIERKAIGNSNSVNVFDYLVKDQTPDNKSRGVRFVDDLDKSRAIDQRACFSDNSIMKEDEQQNMQIERSAIEVQYDSQKHYAMYGFSYGEQPLDSSFAELGPSKQTLNRRAHVEKRTPRVTKSRRTMPNAQSSIHSYKTPARKADEVTSVLPQDVSSMLRSSDKKRKRPPEELDLSLLRPEDELRPDAPVHVLHTGLTGGLSRLLTKRPDWPPSPEYSGGDKAPVSPSSPVRRMRRLKAHEGLGEDKERGRGREREKKERNVGRSGIMTVIPRTGKNRGPMAAQKMKPKRDRDDEQGERSRTSRRNGETEKRKQREYLDDYAGQYEEEHKDETMKDIESSHVLMDNEHNEMVRHRRNGDLELSHEDTFLALVTKGPESGKGFSVNKVLKRWHREMGTSESRLIDEDGLRRVNEDELWKKLRLRRNDRGEVVLFKS